MQDRSQTMWQQARETIRESLSTSAYEIWFENADAGGMEGDTFLLSVPNDFAKTRIESRFLPLIEDSLQEAAGEEVPVRLVVSDRKAPALVTDSEPEAFLPQAATRSSQLNPKYTFNSFIIGSSNRFAHGAAYAVAEEPAEAFNPLFIFGGVGLGKTHLLQAIGHYVINKDPTMTVKYMTVEQFTNDFINCMMDKSKGRLEGFKQKYRQNDVLLIDDVQFLEKKERTQEELFHTFNTMYEAGKQIVLSSDRPPKEIATLEERLRSRFESGLTTDIHAPDLETRLAILRKSVRTRGIPISATDADEVLGFIASGIPTNIRELEGGLIRVAALAQLTNSRVTLDLAREALKDILPASVDSRITIEAIQNEVCRHFGLSLTELKGSKRSQSIVFPRQLAMYLSRELTDASQPMIGSKFGGRDHSTVIHAVNKISNLIKEERSVFDMIQQFTRRLKNQKR